MPVRELIAWILACAMLVALVFQTVRQYAENRETGKMLYGCATSIDSCGKEIDECHAEMADVYYKYGDRIVDYTERVCRVNGWVPPPNWEEELREARQGSD